MVAFLLSWGRSARALKLALLIPGRQLEVAILCGLCLLKFPVLWVRSRYLNRRPFWSGILDPLGRHKALEAELSQWEEPKVLGRLPGGRG